MIDIALFCVSSLMYPSYSFFTVNLSLIADIFEALYMIIGMHIFRQFHFNIVNELYAVINSAVPKLYDIVQNELKKYTK